MGMKPDHKKGKPDAPRIGISLPVHVHDRVSEITKMFGVTQSYLVEAIVSVLSYKELEEMFARAKALHELEQALHRSASREVLTMVRGKSADHIHQMAVAADQAGALK